MPSRKASQFPLLANPSASARVLMIDAGTDATANYAATAAGLASWLGRVQQFGVAAGQTLALAYPAHQGATVVLEGAGATVAIDAAAVAAGFAAKVVNDTGADWTVPAPQGGTLRFDFPGHAKVVAGGSAGLEVYVRGGTRYVHVSGATSA